MKDIHIISKIRFYKNSYENAQLDPDPNKWRERIGNGVTIQKNKIIRIRPKTSLNFND